jgi:hypothetical protein
LCVITETPKGVFQVGERKMNERKTMTKNDDMWYIFSAMPKYTHKSNILTTFHLKLKTANDHRKIKISLAL